MQGSHGRRRPWWLNRAAAISLVGLAFSAVYALMLGWLIPDQVSAEFLRAQATADQLVLDFLLSDASILPEAGPGYERLDRFVRRGILRGDFVRAKLWSVDGTILYSDAEELIGQRFEPDEDYASMAGPTTHISDLDHAENHLEARQYDAPLLETYIPVRRDGELVAVWEIYRDLGPYEHSVGATRRLVWLAVGSGLAVLGLFLVSSFAPLIRAATTQKEEAERRSHDLEWLLAIAQVTTEADDTAMIGQRLTPLLRDAPEIASASVVVHANGETRVLVDVGSQDDLAPPGTDTIEVTSSTAHGSATVRIRPSDRDSPHDTTTLQAVAEQISIGVEKALLTEGLDTYRARLEKVMGQLVAGQEGERRRLAGEVHDSVAQDLYRILYGLRTLSIRAPEGIRSDLGRLEAAVLGASRSVRQLLHQLHPTMAEHVGLATAMRSLADTTEEEYGVQVQLDLSRCPDADEEVKLAVYRIAQEALVNVAKHASVRRAELRVASEDGSTILTVRDHGRPRRGDLTPGMGMWLMKERAESLGGRVEFDSTDEGVTVHVTIPTGTGA